MSTTIGLFVDTSDLYHRIRRKLNGKLCYEAYFEEVKKLGTIQQAFAYGMQTDNEASGFITCLQITGFDTKFKRPRVLKIGDREIKRCDHGIAMTIDVVRTLVHLDTVVLGISNPDYIPLINYIRDCGVRVIIMASCVPKSMWELVDEVIEIDESYLEEEDDG